MCGDDEVLLAVGDLEVAAVAEANETPAGLVAPRPKKAAMSSGRSFIAEMKVALSNVNEPSRVLWMPTSDGNVSVLPVTGRPMAARIWSARRRIELLPASEPAAPVATS